MSALSWQFFWGFLIFFALGHGFGWVLGYTWGKYRQWLRTRRIAQAAEGVLYSATTNYSKDPEYWTGVRKDYVAALDEAVDAMGG